MNYPNMNYGSNFGYNGIYNPYQTNYQANNFQGLQPQQNGSNQAISQQNQNGVPIHEIRFVTKAEAEAYTLFPNRTALLIDSTNNMAYFKSSDNMGLSTMKSFKYSELGGENKEAEEAVEKQEIDTSMFVKREELDFSNFITKDDFKKLIDKVDILQKKVRISDILEGGNDGANKE